MLHYEILFALDWTNLLQELVFRGAAALHLCYGAPRLCEDLEFAGGPEFEAERLRTAEDVLERRIRRRFGLEAAVKETRVESFAPSVAAHQWRLTVMPVEQLRLRVRLEVAAAPAHSREVRAQHAHYSGLPDGYGDLLIAAESLDEVMADKLVSLVAGAGQVRHRDIWDLRWLKKRGAAVRVDWVARKLGDYGTADYLEKLEAMRERLPEIVQGQEFRTAMSRHLPLEVQEGTLDRKEFPPFLANEVRDLLGQVRVGLDARG